MLKPTNIEREVQLLVEGKGCLGFFDAMLRFLSLGSTIQLQNFGGVNDLRGFLPAFIKMSGYSSTVKSIGIVRDAETCARGAFQSVRDILEDNELPSPDDVLKSTETIPSVSVLILPGGNRQGMLETLLYDSIARDSEMKRCIDEFVTCVTHLPSVELRNLHKTQVHAYLATRPVPQSSVGVAAQKGYFDLDDEVFRELHVFLTQIGDAIVQA